MDKRPCASRRALLGAAGLAASGLLLSGCSSIGRAAQAETAEDHGEDGISPGEDLMREHGVLRRILLIYGEVVRRISVQEHVATPVLQEAAQIVRAFVEDYHEKLEENLLFPRYEAAGEFTGLTAVLRQQHAAGRRLTDVILQVSAPDAPTGQAARQAMTVLLNRFAVMYRPHAAREDTVLFPALREIMPPEEVADLGQEFEEKEHAIFGEDGFEDAVARVATIEEVLGIHNLSKFTLQV